MTVDDLIEALNGVQRDNVVNIPSVGIYNLLKSNDLKVFVRTIYEYGKRDGIAECKNMVTKNIFH